MNCYCPSQKYAQLPRQIAQTIPTSPSRPPPSTMHVPQDSIDEMKESHRGNTMPSPKLHALVDHPLPHLGSIVHYFSIEPSGKTRPTDMPTVSIATRPIRGKMDNNTHQGWDGQSIGDPRCRTTAIAPTRPGPRNSHIRARMPGAVEGISSWHPNRTSSASLPPDT